jgi:hypothetical protein
VKHGLIPILATSLIATAGFAAAQQTASPRQVNQDHGSSNHAHDTHLADVNKRGDQVMGFDHAKTTHHFRLMPDGGVIEVEANDPQDKLSRTQIRQHLGILPSSHRLLQECL